MACAPIAGTTAIGRPVAGTTTNQGRVGLCQNWVRRPVKYRNSGSVVSIRASRRALAIRVCARAVRVSNSVAGNPRGGTWPLSDINSRSQPSAPAETWPPAPGGQRGGRRSRLADHGSVSVRSSFGGQRAILIAEVSCSSEICARRYSARSCLLYLVIRRCSKFLDHEVRLSWPYAAAQSSYSHGTNPFLALPRVDRGRR